MTFAGLKNNGKSFYDLVVVVAPVAVVVTVEIMVAARSSASKTRATSSSRTTAENTWTAKRATNKGNKLSERAIVCLLCFPCYAIMTGKYPTTGVLVIMRTESVRQPSFIPARCSPHNFQRAERKYLACAIQSVSVVTPSPSGNNRSRLPVLNAWQAL